MARSLSILQRFDAQLEALFGDWNLYTTLICGVLVLFVAYPLFYSREPDLHPFFLARQSSPSYVRQPGESATYRSLDTPHGYPLRSGLNVKDPGAPKWTSGRDGNLKDIWQQAAKGPIPPDGSKAGETGKLFTVLGTEELITHDWDRLTKDLHAVGHHLRNHGGKRVAIYLPNSVEMVVTLFASAFYGLTPILLPYEDNTTLGVDMLREYNADCLVAAAGSVSLEKVLSQYSGLQQVVWVAERSSRHMEWNQVPEGVGGKAEIAVWHEIIEEKGDPRVSDVSASMPGEELPSIVIVSKRPDSSDYNMVAFTQKKSQNLAAAVAAQLFALPKAQRLGHQDTVSLLAPLTDQYALVVALTALFSNSSLALTSVAGPEAAYLAAFRGITPTVIVATSPTLKRLCDARAGASTSLSEKVDFWNRARTLAAGSMPKAKVSGSPRLIFAYDPSIKYSAPLTSAQMFDLKVLTGARVAYAFTDHTVAGAISQTNVYDYGHSVEHGDRPSHFGPPVSCIELKLIDSPDRKVTDDSGSAGWLVVEGPAVVDGKTVVKSPMTMTEKNTLSYAL